MEMASVKQVLDMQSGGNNDILVAIWMVTYNQEAYIEQAIESVMMQIANFNFKLFVGEDCSTDKTREICIALKEKYPNKIELIANEKNIGGNLNAKNIYNACFNSEAKYIAMLEGDDYWTDVNKLQKQVEVLEKNPECSICFTDNSKLYNDKDLVKNSGKNIQIKTSFLDLIKGNYITTVTVLFRKPKGFALPEWFSQLKIGDWPLYLILLRDGSNAYYLQQDTAVYRFGVGISSHMRKQNSVIVLTILEILNAFLKEKDFITFKKEIVFEIEQKKTELLKSYIRENKIFKANRLFFELVKFKNFFNLSRMYLYCLYQKMK